MKWQNQGLIEGLRGGITEGIGMFGVTTLLPLVMQGEDLWHQPSETLNYNNNKSNNNNHNVNNDNDSDSDSDSDIDSDSGSDIFF